MEVAETFYDRTHMARPEIDSEVWDVYHSGEPEESQEAFEEIVLYYQYLVEGIARKLEVKLPSYIEDQELISHAQLGLLRAVGRYQPSHGPFARYASTVVYGSIIDGLRAADFAPRGLRKQQRELDATVAELQNQGVVSPTNADIASHMEIEETEVRSLQHRILKSEVTPHDPVLLGASQQSSTFWANSICIEFIKWLRDKDIITQKVIALRYWEGLSNKKISDRLQVPVEDVRDAHREVLVEVLPFIQSIARED